MGRKTRPGVDRIAKRELTATAVDHEHAAVVHLAQCIKCKRAGADARARCAAWWTLTRAARYARRQLRAWNLPDTTGMAPMFTEDECDPPPF